MATDLSAWHPGDGIDVLHRLPGLAEPLLEIDLERELQQLRREDSWKRETRGVVRSHDDRQPTFEWE